DIKPANILIEEVSGKIYLADFGIARSDSSKTLTQTGLIMGTPNYISPEQVNGERIDSRSDIYAFGAMLYELITGGPIFSGNSSLEILYQHVNKEPPAMSQSVPNLPREIEFVVSKCLEKSPGQRFQSAEAMGDALDNKKAPSIYFRDRAARKSHRMLPRILAVILVVVAITSYFTLKDSSINEKSIDSNNSINSMSPRAKTPGAAKENGHSAGHSAGLSKKDTAKNKKKKTVPKSDKKKSPSATNSRMSENATAPGEVTQQLAGKVLFSAWPHGVEVWWEKNKLGDATQRFESAFPPGKYKFKFTLPGYTPQVKEITVLPNEIAKVHVKFLKYGFLSVSSNAPAQFFIDGEDCGSNLIHNKKLPIGKYTIKAVPIKNGFIGETKSVEVLQEKTEFVVFVLKKEGEIEK
ncbi:MAG: protein kinase, partial [bacterium]|nr:protein kinase [bacterium]